MMRGFVLIAPRGIEQIKYTDCTPRGIHQSYNVFGQSSVDIHQSSNVIDQSGDFFH